MNRQGKTGIEWCSVWGRPGYTANPVKGCAHACAWEMPNGDIAQCYAKSIAEGVARSAYPGGFEVIRFEENELRKIRNLKTPSGIFIDSMSDLLGRGVKEEWIESTLQAMKESPQHIFFLLTKNPPRLLDYADKFPPNAWVGVSAPPSFMFGKRLTFAQQVRWYNRALECLSKVQTPIRWTSIEPLSFDVSPILTAHKDAINWAVIGAASNGRATSQPDSVWFANVLDTLNNSGVPVFFKGNIDKALANDIAGKWREEFPTPLDAHQQTGA